MVAQYRRWGKLASCLAGSSTPIGLWVFPCDTGTVHPAGILVLAHQGGWDEMLMVLTPIAVFALLLKVANSRAKTAQATRAVPSTPATPAVPDTDQTEIEPTPE